MIPFHIFITDMHELHTRYSKLFSTPQPLHELIDQMPILVIKVELNTSWISTDNLFVFLDIWTVKYFLEGGDVDVVFTNNCNDQLVAVVN